MIHVVFSADDHVSPHEDSVCQWNQFPALIFEEQEKNAVHGENRVYSDVYVFYDDVDVPRKINTNGKKHYMKLLQETITRRITALNYLFYGLESTRKTNVKSKQSETLEQSGEMFICQFIDRTAILTNQLSLAICLHGFNFLLTKGEQFAHESLQ